MPNADVVPPNALPAAAGAGVEVDPKAVVVLGVAVDPKAEVLPNADAG